MKYAKRMFCTGNITRSLWISDIPLPREKTREKMINIWNLMKTQKLSPKFTASLKAKLYRIGYFRAAVNYMHMHPIRHIFFWTFSMVIFVIFNGCIDDLYKPIPTLGHMKHIEVTLKQVKFDRKRGYRIDVKHNNHDKTFYTYLSKEEKKIISDLQGEVISIWFDEYKVTFLRIVPLIQFDRIYHIVFRDNVFMNYKELQPKLERRRDLSVRPALICFLILLVIHLRLFCKYKKT